MLKSIEFHSKHTHDYPPACYGCTVQYETKETAIACSRGTLLAVNYLNRWRVIQAG